MFHHTLKENVSLRVYFDWLTLSFLAGNVNAGGYLSCHRFVSHVTGFATSSGVAFRQESFLRALGELSIPLFFLIGVMISGYLTEKKMAHRIEGARYAPVMNLVAVLLGLVAIGGSFDFFGKFGDPVLIKHDYFLLAGLCMACGLQNAAITSASGYTMRTTHLTGLTTDLGLGIVRAELVGKATETEKLQERRMNLFRLGTIASFVMGSFVAAYIFSRFEYQGFFFPMALAIYCAKSARRED